MALEYRGRVIDYPHKVFGSPVYLKEDKLALLVEYKKCFDTVQDLLRENSELRAEITTLKNENRFMLNLVQE